MLIEYRVLRVEFRNYKLLSSFAGVLEGLLGLQHLDTFPWGLERDGMRIVRECKVTGGETLPSEHADGCVKLAKDGVDGQGGGGGVARGCLWHIVSIWHWWHREKKTKKKPRIPTTPLPALITTTPPPPSIFSLSHRPASAKTIVLWKSSLCASSLQGPLCLCCECGRLKVYGNLIPEPTALCRTGWSQASEA